MSAKGPNATDAAGASRSKGQKSTPDSLEQWKAGQLDNEDRFVADTGWHPQRLVPVAGALRYSQYNFAVRMLMKRIARESGGSTDTTRDHEYTDWTALEQFVDQFAAETAPRA